LSTHIAAHFDGCHDSIPHAGWEGGAITASPCLNFGVELKTGITIAERRAALSEFTEYFLASLRPLLFRIWPMRGVEAKLSLA
jgi:hypothetical protein